MKITLITVGKIKEKYLRDAIAEYPEPRRHAPDVLLLAVQQGPYLGDIRPIQICHRLEAADAALKQQVHQKRLHRVVVVVAQRDLADAPLCQSGVQAPPPQLGAQGAGVLLLSLPEHDVVHRHRDADVGHVQLLAVVRHRREVHVRHPRLQRDGLHLKRLGVERPQPRQRRQRQQTVLAAGHADGHRLPRLDHVVVLHTAADKPQYMLHTASLPVKIKFAFQEKKRKQEISGENIRCSRRKSNRG